MPLRLRADMYGNTDFYWQKIEQENMTFASIPWITHIITVVVGLYPAYGGVCGCYLVLHLFEYRSRGLFSSVCQKPTISGGRVRSIFLCVRATQEYAPLYLGF
jgi:hypothetical protein